MAQVFRAVGELDTPYEITTDQTTDFELARKWLGWLNELTMTMTYTNGSVWMQVNRDDGTGWHKIELDGDSWFEQT